MENCISRNEHEEFAKRMEEENHRQNHRLELLEENVRQINELTASVKQLAANMENMLREQEKQGNRLELLEGRDGEMWRKIIGYVTTFVIGAIISFVFSQIGM